MIHHWNVCLNIIFKSIYRKSILVEYSCTECECDLFKQYPPPRSARGPRSGVLSTREEPSEPLPASENRVPGVIASPPTEQIPIPPSRWIQTDSRQNTILAPSRDGFESALHHSKEKVCNSGTKNTITDCDIISEDDSSLPIPDICKNAAKRKSLFLFVRPEKVLCSDICCENGPDLKPPSYFGI